MTKNKHKERVREVLRTLYPDITNSGKKRIDQAITKLDEIYGDKQVRSKIELTKRLQS